MRGAAIRSHGSALGLKTGRWALLVFVFLSSQALIQWPPQASKQLAPVRADAVSTVLETARACDCTFGAGAGGRGLLAPETHFLRGLVES